MEVEGAYAPDFFGSAPELSSSLMTVMSHFLLVPQVGPIRPFMLIGVGLMKTHVNLTRAGLLATDNIINDAMFGWDVGGGVMAFAGRHFGVRGDLRYFHSFQDYSVIGFTLPSVKFNYSRASAGVILEF